VFPSSWGIGREDGDNVFYKLCKIGFRSERYLKVIHLHIQLFQNAIEVIKLFFWVVIQWKARILL